MDTFLETLVVHLEKGKKETVLVRWVQVRCWTLFLETQAVCL